MFPFYVQGLFSNFWETKHNSALCFCLVMWFLLSSAVLTDVLVFQVSRASSTPTSEGPFITGTTLFHFLLITSHTAVKNPSKIIKCFYALCATRTTTHSYWFCLLCNHFGLHGWLRPPSIHHLSCNVNKDLGRTVAALSTPPRRSMGISQSGGRNQAGDTDY